MKTVAVVAPHPDDESLGCGGTILRHKQEGDSVHWLIMSRLDEDCGATSEQIKSRGEVIESVARAYPMDSYHQAAFSATYLDVVAQQELIAEVSLFFKKLEPDMVYLPYREDAHSDHESVFDAVVACTKSFRYPFVKSLRAYETISETEFGCRPQGNTFKPNLWIDITSFLERKLAILALYKEEMGEHPFPRSEQNLRALATVRGATAGCESAEAFMILKEIC